MNRTFFIALTVSLGGFLFGFDMGIISGVMDTAGPFFSLDDTQIGWVTSCPTFVAMFAMLVAGRVSDAIGRKPILIVVAFLYALSALLSAFSVSYDMLWISRMIGGVAFGAALILAPLYIAEIAGAQNRGKLVATQQLNIMLGFFVAFLSNYFFNEYSSGYEFITKENLWQWMLGVEALPALVYFCFLFYVPKSPRWLYAQNRKEEGRKVLELLHGKEMASTESEAIEKNLDKEKNVEKASFAELLKPALRFIVVLGLIIGILQQASGINAIYFYATSIFKLTGIGTGNAFAQGAILGLISVICAVIAMVLMDRVGRRPLMLFGIAGISASLLLCSYEFGQAKYHLSTEKIAEICQTEELEKKQSKLEEKKSLSKFDQKALDNTKSSIRKLTETKEKLSTIDKTISYENEVEFKQALQEFLVKKDDEDQMELYNHCKTAFLEQSIEMNALNVLIGILGFIAFFNLSLGPVMWVMLSEMYPNKIRGLAIGTIGLVNSFTAWFVTQIFPWELSNLGGSQTFLIFGLVALVGFFLLYKLLPETKGKSLEQLESELIKS
jgi:MFS family permease